LSTSPWRWELIEHFFCDTERSVYQILFNPHTHKVTVYQYAFVSVVQITHLWSYWTNVQIKLAVAPWAVVFIFYDLSCPCHANIFCPIIQNTDRSLVLNWFQMELTWRVNILHSGAWDWTSHLSNERFVFPFVS
jgi:hypothetical protein